MSPPRVLLAVAINDGDKATPKRPNGTVAPTTDSPRTKSSQRVPTLEERDPNCDSRGDEGEAGDSAELDLGHVFASLSISHKSVPNSQASAGLDCGGLV
jgi:hypothetical protein